MEYVELEKLVLPASTPEALEETIEYIARHMPFVKERDAVLICFAKDKPGSFGELMEKAVLRLGGVPVMVEKDWRWMTLLRLAFANRVKTIVAPPLVVLGLTKLARQKGTPLYIRRMVTAGYPCIDWMVEGISRGLDCDPWTVFASKGSCVVAGFSCGHGSGVHIRDDIYDICIVDQDGNRVPDGDMGDILLFRKDAPDVVVSMGDRGRIQVEPCACGCKSTKLVDITHGKSSDPELAQLGKDLMSWTSILDCRLKRSECGLEMEIVTFAGEKMPNLPSCAKRVVRAWNPEKDEPFFYVPGVDKY